MLLSSELYSRTTNAATETTISISKSLSSNTKSYLRFRLATEPTIRTIRKEVTIFILFMIELYLPDDVRSVGENNLSINQLILFDTFFTLLALAL